MLNDKITISNILKEERVKQNLTLKQLGENLGMSESTISRYENDGINKLEDINAICNVLNLDMQTVLFGQPYKKTNDELGNIKYNTLLFDIINANEESKHLDFKIENDIKLNKKVYIYSNDYMLFNKWASKFKTNEYDIKLLDLKYDCSKSSTYNPISLLTDEMKIINFSKFIASNIVQDSSTSLLIETLLRYLIKYRPVEEQNFESIMKMLKANNIDHLNSRSKTPLDRLIDEVKICDKKSIVSKRYEFYNQKDKALAVSKIYLALDIFDLEKVKSLTYGVSNMFNINQKQVIFIIKPNTKSFKPILQMFNYQLNEFLNNLSETNNINTTEFQFDNSIIYEKEEQRKGEEQRKREEQIEEKWCRF